jgi:sulfate permease, SulP family
MLMAASEQTVHVSPDNSVLTTIKSPALLTKEVLAGLVVALALIPEAIAFSLIAGVDPIVGLYSSFIMAMAIAFLGGRPAMITAATGAIAIFMALSVPTVGDEGKLPESLPEFFIPNVPLTIETLSIIAPFALAMALVGLLESLLTAKLVDDITDTHSRKTRESLGQCGANILSGFFGGMGGCAMIGQTMINVKASGARTRISTLIAGLFLLILILSLGDFVAMIPMAALVAVMIMVSVATFNWHSVLLSTLKRMPKSETFVMATTVVVVVFTHNLAIGVIVGVITAMIMLVRRVAHFADLTRTVVEEEGKAVANYKVTGELFFASSNDLYSQFSYTVDPKNVVIDMSESHIWDASAIAALDSILTKYESQGKSVELDLMKQAQFCKIGSVANWVKATNGAGFSFPTISLIL